MARPKAPDHERQRTRIEQLAVEAFARDGYAAVSMSSLARACGTSKAGLYHYFPSKEAILSGALERYATDLLAAVRAARASEPTPGGQLAAIVRALMEMYRDARPYHVALLNDVRFLAPAARERVRERERAVVDELARTVERAYPDRVNRSNRTVVTMALLGMINFTFAWLRPEGRVGHARFAGMVVDLWSNGLGGAGAPFLRGNAREQAVRIES